MAIFFWLSVGLIAYSCVGFPLLVILRGVLFRRSVKQQEITPAVDLIVAAYNEEASIGAKIENMLELDYPRERLQIVVVSDGSNDRTEEIVAGYAGRGVQLMALPRGGKAAALNKAIAKCDGEIILFSDANSIFAADAVKKLVRSFADPRVGGVAGDQRYRKASEQRVGECAANDSGERAYWNYDRLLKVYQSRAGHVTSATGAIYAIRRALFQTVPEGVTDDFATSTAVIAQGYRLVFEREAIAYEAAAGTNSVEYGRKVRIITRGLRAVLLRRSLLNPLRTGFYSMQLFSHKVLRRLLALPLLTAFVTSGILAANQVFYQAVFAMQAAFYLLAITGSLLHHTRLGKKKIVLLPFFFCMVNIASLVALMKVLTGQRIVVWETQRPADSSRENMAITSGATHVSSK